MTEKNTEEIDWEAVEKQRAEERERAIPTFLCYATTHTGQLLGPADWKETGLAEIYPNDTMTSWSIYCKEYSGKKYVGAAIYDDYGVIDMLEFNGLEADVPLAAETAPDFRPRPKKEIPQGEIETGTYSVTVTYRARQKGKVQTVTKTPYFTITADHETTKEDLFKQARGIIVMEGLHNFGLAIEPGEKSQQVHFVVKNKDGLAEYESECELDPSGHIYQSK
jgi:hypothetical protein